MTPTRAIVIAAALLAASAPAAFAQAKRPPAGKPAAAPAPPAPPPIWPCRTEAEVCYLGIVMGPKVAIIYSNSPEAQASDGLPVDVAGPDGARLDLSKETGRVVMMTGTFDPKAGLTKAEVVEIAGPLQSLVVKAQLAGAAGEEPAPGPKGGPRRR